MHAGVRGLAGQLSFLHPPATPCLACFLEEGPAEQPLPILGATAGVMGCLQALEALKYLAGMDGLAENRIVFFDGASMSFDSVAVARRPGCPACGSSPA
jgi:adenylyltransferase/sulfurtransferase